MRTLLLIAPLLLGAAQSTGKVSPTGDVSNSRVTATGSTTARALRDRAADVVNVKDYGAVGDGSTDDTAAIQAAMTAATTGAGRPLIFPAGTFLVDPGTLNWATAKGVVIRGAGQLKTIIRARSAGHVLEVSGGWTHTIEVSDLAIEGAGRTAAGGPHHCVYFHDNGPYSGVSHLVLRDLKVSACSGKGIYIPEEWHSRFENISVDDVGDNLFELQGGNTTTLIRCYAQAVQPGKAGFRIYKGRVTMIGCNGVNPAAGTADWGVFGQTVADDGVANYAAPTLIGCNLEDFSNRGLWLKTGSTAHLINTTFISAKSGSMIGLQVDFAGGVPVTIDQGTVFALGVGGAWTNGHPIHSGATNPPAIRWGTPGTAADGWAYWLTASSQGVPLPSIAAVYGGSYTSAVAVNALAVGGGTRIARHLSAAAAWTPAGGGGIADGANASTTITVTGAAIGDTVAVGLAPTTAMAAGALLFGAVTAADTVTVTLQNESGGNYTPGASTVRADVWQH
jgi:hypothetical protein